MTLTVICINTGEKLTSNSVSKIAKFTGVHISNVYRAIKNKKSRIVIPNKANRVQYIIEKK